MMIVAGGDGLSGKNDAAADQQTIQDEKVMFLILLVFYPDLARSK